MAKLQQNTVRVTVWGSPESGGDGSVYVTWFLKEKDARANQETADEPWGEDCSFPVETFVGSNIHKRAR